MGQVSLDGVESDTNKPIPDSQRRKLGFVTSDFKGSMPNTPTSVQLSENDSPNYHQDDKESKAEPSALHDMPMEEDDKEEYAPRLDASSPDTLEAGLALKQRNDGGFHNSLLSMSESSEVNLPQGLAEGSHSGQEGDDNLLMTSDMFIVVDSDDEFEESVSSTEEDLDSSDGMVSSDNETKESIELVLSNEEGVSPDESVTTSMVESVTTSMVDEDDKIAASTNGSSLGDITQELDCSESCKKSQSKIRKDRHIRKAETLSDKLETSSANAKFTADKADEIEKDNMTPNDRHNLASPVIDGAPTDEQNINVKACVPSNAGLSKSIEIESCLKRTPSARTVTSASQRECGVQTMPIATNGNDATDKGASNQDVTDMSNISSQIQPPHVGTWMLPLSISDTTHGSAVKKILPASAGVRGDIESWLLPAASLPSWSENSSEDSPSLDARKPICARTDFTGAILDVSQEIDWARPVTQSSETMVDSVSSSTGSSKGWAFETTSKGKVETTTDAERDSHNSIIGFDNNEKHEQDAVAFPDNEKSLVIEFDGQEQDEKLSDTLAQNSDTAGFRGRFGVTWGSGVISYRREKSDIKMKIPKHANIEQHPRAKRKRYDPRKNTGCIVIFVFLFFMAPVAAFIVFRFVFTNDSDATDVTQSPSIVPNIRPVLLPIPSPTQRPLLTPTISFPSPSASPPSYRPLPSPLPPLLTPAGLTSSPSPKHS